MPSSDQLFWNLAQAAAWVVYRERTLVESLVNPGPNAFGAIGMYPKIWPKERKKVGSLSELHSALSAGRLIARGYRSGESVLSEIPNREWEDLHLSPPQAYDASRLAQKIEPWLLIRVDAADMQRLWRTESERSGRTRFDPDTLRVLYAEAKASNPGFSQNALIAEVQLAFTAKTGRAEPSHSTVQRALKE
jgi:hypothetical protein